MIQLNCDSGMKKRRVIMQVTEEVELLVGGECNEDRIEAVTEMWRDHYDEIASNSYFRDHLVSLRIDEIRIVDKEDIDGK